VILLTVRDSFLQSRTACHRAKLLKLKLRVTENPPGPDLAITAAGTALDAAPTTSAGFLVDFAIVGEAAGAFDKMPAAVVSGSGRMECQKVPAAQTIIRLYTSDICD
jgi:hypothetical protein